MASRTQFPMTRILGFSISPAGTRRLNILIGLLAVVCLFALVVAYLGTSRREIRRELVTEAQQELANLVQNTQGVLAPLILGLDHTEKDLMASEPGSDLPAIPDPALMNASAFGFMARDGRLRLSATAGVSRSLPATSSCGSDALVTILDPGAGGIPSSGSAELLFLKPVIRSGEKIGCLFATLPLTVLQGENSPLVKPLPFTVILSLDRWEKMLMIREPELEAKTASREKDYRAWPPAPAEQRGEMGGAGLSWESPDFHLTYWSTPLLGHDLLMGIGFSKAALDSRFGEVVLVFLPIPLVGLALILVTTFFISRLNAAGARLEEGFKTLEARRQHQELMEMTYNAIVSLKTDGTIFYANEAAAGLLGEKREQMEGKDFFRYIESGQCLLRGSEHLPGCELLLLSLVRADGTVRHCEAVSRIFRDDGEERQLLVISDITERELYLQKKRRLERMATLGETAARISHEINNPLVGVITFAEQGLKRCSDEPCRAYFGKIKIQAEKVSGIINGYLRLSRDSQEAHRNEDLAPLIEEAISFFSHTGLGKRISFVTDVPQGTPAVCVDRDKITQALLNLFINAAHATEGRDDVRVAVTVAPASEGRIGISVADNGPGIRPEHLRIIFDPSFTSKPEGKGTGLGLAIVREIIEDEHHGSVSVRSIPGEGATFTLVLPVADGRCPKTAP